MTYGTEVREDTNKTKRMLRVTDMKTMRTIVGNTRRDRVRNTDVGEQCGIQDIVIREKQRKRQWYNHVRRMDENRLPRIVLENKPPGPRPPGRPPKRSISLGLPKLPKRNKLPSQSKQNEPQKVTSNIEDVRIFATNK
ncbi:uncharacterized protein LOC132702361 [Cylas formicarius]|uniref:uncharacterized protein LOC132702361 n=1 Tax=Cylas formicarius TaxID=197179 RepID=UPI002958B2B1|nr:uncharacterized protein LOC132702361 [Cylas formicarius]